MRNFLYWATIAPIVILALPWDGPSPTEYNFAEIDYWSPAPTAAPKLTDGIFELFKKRQLESPDTCGYEEGNQTLSLTCNDLGFVCATNRNFGVHGCCNPRSIDSCSLPTTCYAFTDLASCTGDCLSNAYNAVCTQSNRPSCYNWLYDYGTTTMTEFGCANIGFTSTVSRFYDGQDTSIADETSQLEIPISTRIITIIQTGEDTESAVGAAPATIPSGVGNDGVAATPVPGADNSNSNNNNGGGGTPVGAIVGGVVGGIAVLGGAIAIGVFFLFRKRKQKRQQAATGGVTDAGAGAGAAMSSPQSQYIPPKGAPGDNSAWQHNQYPQGQYSQGQYPQGQYPQQAYPPQGGYDPNVAQGGYYQPGQEQKYGYVQNQGVPTSPGQQGVGGMPMQQGAQPIQQLDSTPIGNPQGRPVGQTGQVFEAP